MIFVPIRRIGVATCVTPTDRGGPLTRAMGPGSNKSASLPSLVSPPSPPSPRATCSSSRRKNLCARPRATYAYLSTSHTGEFPRIPRPLGLNEWLIRLIGARRDVASLSMAVSVTESCSFVHLSRRDWRSVELLQLEYPDSLAFGNALASRPRNTRGECSNSPSEI